MNKNKLQRDAKRRAYAEKNEKKERGIINWIFVVLILLGVLYAVYSMILFS